MPTPERIICSLFLQVVVSCAGPIQHSTTSAVPPGSRVATDSCPSLADSTTTTVPSEVVIDNGPRMVPGTRYVSILIDGQRAAWNQRQDMPGPQLGPDLDPSDIQAVEVVKPVVAQSAYGTCPGVGLILITTKSKTWRPHSH